jgi:hypothetical protein
LTGSAQNCGPTRSQYRSTGVRRVCHMLIVARIDIYPEV